jgi:hypothetical protein
MTTATIRDARSIEQLYPRNVWQAEAADNSRGSQSLHRGLVIESEPDADGNFRLRRATRQAADESPARHVIFICPFMGKAYDIYTPTLGVHGAIREKHDALTPLDDEYEDFIARVLETAKHAKLAHIPGPGERLPKG